ncbi:cytochrome-c oxidase, cbb3-type subunit II [Magnetospirillum moscoviense]|uniref:Peptidase S41 n=1 Tax=Magnetospirillum moscoviense TaxID=1437059 RepID=A0A178MVJ5_9PROT|nr:cytochrome-c oxidase, cbb3-type subunit II [Magnetospirillum moscoviense]MBF0326085.1 cytochrome-c oxidase, cbb3-type subunit II [Alphaproteobacteria bacterium]OAN54182.1 peptidase S41 [Magnetospirillum moscoviense]
MSVFKHHKHLETNVFFLAVGILLCVIVGGLVEVVPLFHIESTIEKVDGVRPYSPLEQAGRDIYVREGCYNCHSQMIRPFKDEVERYGHYSLAAESKYDHPFQWSSKRTGPDLARVGGKYTNDWHVRHMINPRDVVPESIMPGYPHLMRALDTSSIQGNMTALKIVGVPYTDAQIANAVKDLTEQASSDSPDAAVLKSYPKARMGDVDGDPKKVTEMDALVAYLQVLGTMVDFTKVKPETIRR